ncbi:MAG: MFS transporter, partial [Burkholderiaceae bacterium]
MIGRLFPALGEADVRRYALGQIVSVIGGWTQTITINLLAWSLTASPGVLGLLNFLLFAPSLVVGPLGGSLLTPSNARQATTLILCSSLAISIGFTALAAVGQLSIGWLIGLSAIAGVFNAIEMPARQVLLIECVRDKLLIANAVSINSLAWNSGRMVGPAIGALLFANSGAAWGFASNALGLLVMLGCVQTVRLSPANDAAPVVRGGLRDAFAYVRADRQASLMLPVLACIGVFAGGYQTLVPVLADRAHGDTAAYTGLFFAAAGGGSLAVAALLSSRLSVPLTRRLLLWMPWLTALMLCSIAAFESTAAVMLSFALLGASITFTGPGTNASLQQVAPRHLRGALSGLFTMSFMGTIPFGQLLAGALAQQLAVRQALLIMAA